MLSVILYTRPGCHLCDEMKDVIRRVAQHVPLALEEIDISADAELEARYRVEIPVLMIDGKKAAKHRITENDLRRILTSKSGGSGKSGGPGG